MDGKQIRITVDESSKNRLYEYKGHNERWAAALHRVLDKADELDERQERQNERGRR